MQLNVYGCMVEILKKKRKKKEENERTNEKTL